MELQAGLMDASPYRGWTTGFHDVVPYFVKDQVQSACSYPCQSEPPPKSGRLTTAVFSRASIDQPSRAGHCTRPTG